MAGGSWLGARHCDFYLFGYWIFLYYYKYSWALFWNIVTWKWCDLFASCFYDLLGRTRAVFSLERIMSYKWGEALQSTRWSASYKVFQSGWWEQAMSQALRELWVLSPQILLGDSSASGSFLPCTHCWIYLGGPSADGGVFPLCSFLHTSSPPCELWLPQPPEILSSALQRGEPTKLPLECPCFLWPRSSQGSELGQLRGSSPSLPSLRDDCPLSSDIPPVCPYWPEAEVDFF